MLTKEQQDALQGAFLTSTADRGRYYVKIAVKDLQTLDHLHDAMCAVRGELGTAPLSVARAPNNVVKVEFSASPYAAIGDMRDEIYSVIMAYASTVPLAAVLGVLRIIESELLDQHQ